MSKLFNRDKSAISRHIKKPLVENVKKQLLQILPQFKKREREVTCNIEYYYLDIIISVGYRVKSNTGVEFRKWANKILKEHVLKAHIK